MLISIFIERFSTIYILYLIRVVALLIVERYIYSFV